jgi:hypothetical protein
MGIQWAKPVNNGETDLTKYTPLNNLYTIPINTPSFVTMVDITGKGYLLKAALTNPNSINTKIKITIDGSVVAYYMTPNINRIIGIAPFSDVKFDSTTSLVTRLGTHIPNFDTSNYHPTYPSASEQIGKLLLIYSPILFEQSLKIEVMNPSASYNAYLEFQGGLLS